MSADTQKESDLLRDYFPNHSFEELLTMGENAPPKLVKSIIEGVDKMMKKYASKITYTQIRNILQLVKNDEFEQNISKFFMVIPKLAYIEARPQKQVEGKEIIQFIRNLANHVENDASNYQGFVEILNTIVAFHKLHG